MVEKLMLCFCGVEELRGDAGVQGYRSHDGANDNDLPRYSLSSDTHIIHFNIDCQYPSY